MAPQQGLIVQRRTWVNLLLLFVVGVLAFAIWQAERSDEPPRLTQLSTDSITRIEIRDLSGKYIVLEKVQSVWRRSEHRANADRISQLLKLCDTTSLVRFEMPTDLRPFGLETPQIELELNNETLAFGNTDPVNGWRYVSYHGQIHLIADGFYHHLSAPAEAWLESH